MKIQIFAQRFPFEETFYLSEQKMESSFPFLKYYSILLVYLFYLFFFFHIQISSSRKLAKKQTRIQILTILVPYVWSFSFTYILFSCSTKKKPLYVFFGRLLVQRIKNRKIKKFKKKVGINFISWHEKRSKIF